MGKNYDENIGQKKFEKVIKLLSHENTIEKEDEEEFPFANKSQLDCLFEICNQLSFFCDYNGKAYACIPEKDYIETKPIGSNYFKGWLINEYQKIFSKMPKANALKNVVEILNAKTSYQHQKHELSVRLSKQGDKIWYDMCDNNCAVMIGPSGWEIAKAPPITFRNYSHQKSQVRPAVNGKIQEILNFLNLEEKHQQLFLVWLVSSLIPNIPKPLLSIFGEKGSAKTTLSKMLKKVIDPSAADIITLPTDLKMLSQILDHHWYCNFDNLSSINQDVSNALCCAVTGNAVFRRQLYTDEQDLIYNYMRSISLNGLEVVTTRDDLLDRSILIQLNRISSDKREDEASLWERFEKVRPSIIGGMFDILSRAMQIYPKVELGRKYRMADFTIWGYAISEAMGFSGELFLRQYSDNLKEHNNILFESNTLLCSLNIFMSKKKDWTGMARDLYMELLRVVKAEGLDTKSETFPKAANILTRKLNSMRSNLESAGYEYSLYRNNNGAKITIKRNI